MSVRAYRVIEIKTEKNESFNLWHDDDLMEWLRANAPIDDQLNGDGAGLIEISVEDMGKALSELAIKDYRREAIQNDIDASKDTGFIQYYCY